MNYLSLESPSRQEELVYLLMRFPASPQMILEASQMWTHPFPSLRVTQRFLHKMHQKEWVSRISIPLFRLGQPAYLYFLTPKAHQLCGEVQEEYALRGMKSSIFQPINLKNNFHHDLAAALYCCALE